ncbi:zinc-dependent alcohol dehydrogenase [Microdochium trichocladiopsis]|uniref:Zinc-dependent alcohol dehydrogenase n=1 Tax=Microdochium trichocladiopsis TaxID=1682393 RepID=A0A9P8Y642_9PEZI|nr:zinc-dependent alcohol dehydrogenase [Microdochium trichocladiopsis]KAH7030865.1 zinc-dependent alcohol dehydrogenase [Microdochium trichocladiopsis]
MAPSAMPTVSADHSPISSKLSTINASVLHGPQDLRLETRTIEEPAAGELQIAIRSTGICGSDVSYYKRFANGDLCACGPLSLGHESSGTVVAIGQDVKGFGIGDRVALEVGIPCSQCSVCRKGRYNLCKRMRFRSSAKSVPHFQGTLQERINHPARWCYKLPDHVSFDAAALLEPLSVALHAVNRASPAPGSSALVTGAGTVGLLTAAMALRAGCASVTITDVDEGRVNYALKKGFATHGFVVPKPSQDSTYGSASNSGITTPQSQVEVNVRTASSLLASSIQGQLQYAKSLAAEVLALTRPPPDLQDEDEDEGVDVTFECTGKEICMHTGLYATRPGGKLIMVGMGTPIQTLPISVAHLREIDILGIFRYANTYAAGIRLLCSASTAGGVGGFPSLDDMITHRFKGLEAAKQAFELACRTSDDDGNLVIKVIIEA